MILTVIFVKYFKRVNFPVKIFNANFMGLRLKNSFYLLPMLSGKVFLGLIKKEAVRTLLSFLTAPLYIIFVWLCRRSK